MRVPVSDAFVFFGVTGDLAYKQIFPALHALTRLPLPGRAGAGPAPVLWAAAADDGVAAARRAALGDADAVTAVKRSYARIGRSLRS